LTLGVVKADWLTDWESWASTPSVWIRPLPLTRARFANLPSRFCGLAFLTLSSPSWLHHAELGAMTAAVTRLLRPHRRLFVYDFDWDAYDDRSADWLARHDPSDADNSVAGWRHEHPDLHTGATIKEAPARLEPLLGARRPYLARMLARHDLEPVEHALIDVQMLPALGFWMTAERTR
jgi:hypothetical protein